MRKPGLSPGLFCSSSIIASGGELLRTELLFVCMRLRRLGLDTCFCWVFGGLQAKTSKSKDNRWVVAPCGLHSGLRQRGGRCAAGLDAGAEAPAYLRGNGKSNNEGKNRQRRNAGVSPHTAQRTMKLSVASVEMTILGWRKRTEVCTLRNLGYSEHIRSLVASKSS